MVQNAPNLEQCTEVYLNLSKLDFLAVLHSHYLTLSPRSFWCWLNNSVYQPKNGLCQREQICPWTQRQDIYSYEIWLFSGCKFHMRYGYFLDTNFRKLTGKNILFCLFGWYFSQELGPWFIQVLWLYRTSVSRFTKQTVKTILYWSLANDSLSINQK